MPNTLSDWIILLNNDIDKEVTNTSAGVYVLTTSWTDGVLYVGRSDDDLNKRLKDHVGETSPTKKKIYFWFKYEYASSPKSAYEKECRLYHTLNPPDNKKHPDKPEGTTYPCPVCGN